MATLQPYLFFGGRCEEALQFYGKAVGAETQYLVRFKESPEPHPEGSMPPGSEEKIMHANVRVGSSIFMVSDGGCDGRAEFGGFSLSLTVNDEAEARRAFDALAEGGSVKMPLDRTFWSPCFGMLEDRFGVGWMISVMA